MFSFPIFLVNFDKVMVHVTGVQLHVLFSAGMNITNQESCMQ